MNNIILDVAIGLIFLYLLYSLLATSINELIATIFAYRHRMLEKAIEQMLDGKNYSYYWWDKLFNLFWWIFYSTKKRINKNRGLEYMTGLQYKSFFSTQDVSITGSGEGDVTLKLKRSKLNKKAGLFASRVTNHPLYLRKAENSILYNKPAYLSASAFSDILTDILNGKDDDASPPPILMKNISSFVNDSAQVQGDLKKILNIFIEQANGDVQKFRLLLEDWFDDTMQRVSGWYKRQASKVLFIIGIVLAVGFNVNTIEIAGKLSENQDLRKMMVQSATEYVQAKSKAEGNQPLDTSLSAAKEKIREIQNLYNDTLAKVNMMMGLGWNYPAEKVNQKRWWIPDFAIKPFNKVVFILSETIQSPRKWIGFLITALAMTLGAPFWFDLLNKLVNIRSGGNKPKENDVTKSTLPKTTALNQKPDPLAKG